MTIVIMVLMAKTRGHLTFNHTLRLLFVGEVCTSDIRA